MRLKIWLVILSFLGTTVAQACTSIVLNSTDNGRVYARTMEFGIPLKSAVLITPRGYDFKGSGGLTLLDSISRKISESH